MAFWSTRRRAKQLSGPVEPSTVLLVCLPGKTQETATIEEIAEASARGWSGELVAAPALAARSLIGVVSILGLAFGALSFFYAFAPWGEPTAIPFLRSRVADTAAFGILGLFVSYTSIRIFQCRAWAWWLAFISSGVMLGLAGLLVFRVAHPRDDFARSESGFGFGLALIIAVPSAVSFILLSLPLVRRKFFTIQVVFQSGGQEAIEEDS